jgi:hypothetical protein
MRATPTFSFNTGIGGGNTTKYNFFHVLPMTQTPLGPVPPGKGVVPYLSGPGAGKAVYDTLTGLSWTLNANLAAFDNFGVTNTIAIPPDMNVHGNLRHSSILCICLRMPTLGSMIS